MRLSSTYHPFPDYIENLAGCVYLLGNLFRFRARRTVFRSICLRDSESECQSDFMCYWLPIIPVFMCI